MTLDKKMMEYIDGLDDPQQAYTITHGVGYHYNEYHGEYALTFNVKGLPYFSVYIDDKHVSILRHRYGLFIPMAIKEAIVTRLYHLKQLHLAYCQSTKDHHTAEFFKEIYQWLYESDPTLGHYQAIPIVKDNVTKLTGKMYQIDFMKTQLAWLRSKWITYQCVGGSGSNYWYYKEHGKYTGR